MDTRHFFACTLVVSLAVVPFVAQAQPRVAPRATAAETEARATFETAAAAFAEARFAEAHHDDPREDRRARGARASGAGGAGRWTRRAAAG